MDGWRTGGRETPGNLCSVDSECWRSRTQSAVRLSKEEIVTKEDEGVVGDRQRHEVQSLTATLNYEHGPVRRTVRGEVMCTTWRSPRREAGRDSRSREIFDQSDEEDETREVQEKRIN